MSHSIPPFRRDAATWTAYGLLSLLTLQIGLVGPIMPYLRAEMGLTYAEGALHTSAFAIGMMASGFIVAPIDTRFGRKGVALIASFALALTFLSLTFAPNLYISILSAGLMGLIGSMIVAIAPMILSAVHPHDFDRALAEANLVAYLGGLAAPIAVSLASRTLGWHGAALAGFVVLAALVTSIRASHLPTDHEDTHESDGSLGIGYWAFWSLLAIAVATEFCFIVWGASYLEQITGLARGDAVLASTCFPIGMVLGRLIGLPILKRIGSAKLATASLILAFIGFLVFWIFAKSVFAVAGLFIAGLGIANLYSTGIAMALNAAGSAIKKGAERSSIASGLAIIASPLILGALADALGLYLAYAIIPMFIIAGLIAIRIGTNAR